MYMMRCTEMQKMKKKMCDECVQRVLVTRNLCEVKNERFCLFMQCNRCDAHNDSSLKHAIVHGKT